MHLKISSAKWRPFCPGRDELKLGGCYQFSAKPMPETMLTHCQLGPEEQTSMENDVIWSAGIIEIINSWKYLKMEETQVMTKQPQWFQWWPGNGSFQCTWKTFMIHQTCVRWDLCILFKFVKSLIKHLGLAIGNVRCVWWFSWTLSFTEREMF